MTSGEDSGTPDAGPPALGRAERRLLRRIFNGRTIPIMVDDRQFLTFKDANRYLLSLADDAREKAYLEMKNPAVSSNAT